MRIAICDDDLQHLKIMQEIIYSFEDKCGSKFEVYTYCDSQGFLNVFNSSNRKIDILFLDIEMPKRDGIDIAKELRDKDKELIIIYISSYEQYWKKLFSVQPFRFIKKPFKDIEVEKVLYQAINELKNKNNCFTYTFKKNTYRIPFHWIYYFESNKRKILIYDERNEIIGEFYSKMNALDKEVTSKDINFIRVHQSFLINFKYINKWTNDHIELMNKKLVPTSENKIKSAKIQFLNLLEKESVD
ncbi:LytR/AlgR family response regulator transcription factor [Marinilactibacillus psychrotolerans]|uniref:LytR/AlgR family response regulator transcription factor n=1 Tax=Marinilactibacillus psychrotolerans TaxID=191770 RepID=UPI003888F3EC